MKKIITGPLNIFQWVIAVALGIGTIGAFGQSIISGVFMALATICICPFTRKAIANFIDKRLGEKSPVNKIKGWMYGVAAFLFVCIGASSAPVNDTSYEESSQNLIQTESSAENDVILESITENDKEEDVKVGASVSTEVPTSTPTPTPTPTPTLAPAQMTAPAPMSEPTPILTPNPTLTPTPTPTSTPVSTPTPVISQGESAEKGVYAVNDKNGKIHIVGDCSATGTGEHAMDEPVYFNTYEDAEAYSVKIEPKLEKRRCGNCWK